MKTGDRIKTSSQVDCVWSESRYVEAALTYEAVFYSEDDSDSIGLIYNILVIIQCSV